MPRVYRARRQLPTSPPACQLPTPPPSSPSYRHKQCLATKDVGPSTYVSLAQTTRALASRRLLPKHSSLDGLLCWYNTPHLTCYNTAIQLCWHSAPHLTCYNTPHPMSCRSNIPPTLVHLFCESMAQVVEVVEVRGLLLWHGASRGGAVACTYDPILCKQHSKPATEHAVYATNTAATASQEESVSCFHETQERTEERLLCT